MTEGAAGASSRASGARGRRFPADSLEPGIDACRWKRDASQVGPLGVGYAPGSACGRPARRDGLCVFHAPKLSEEAKGVLAAPEREEAEGLDADFRQELDTLIVGAESSDVPDPLLFTGFQFPSFALSGQVFSMPVSFDEARFVGPVKLSRVSFRDRTSFVGAHFCGDADFFQTEFREGIFNSAKFDGHTVFAEAAHGSLNMSNATFGGGASFVETRIRLGLYGGTVFSGETTFWPVTFTEAGDFQFAKFLAAAAFREVQFEQVADFSAAVFRGTTEFDRVTFQGNAEFGGSAVEGRLEFAADDDSQCFEAGADFSNVRLDPKSVMSFERVDLSDASFLWTNIESVVFKDVRWRASERKFGPIRLTRHALADEYQTAGVHPDYAPLSLNYRQLVRNYEAQRDYETAESFYIGEMEMQRRQLGLGRPRLAGFFRSWLNGHGLYLLLSRYGTSYMWSLAILAVLVAAISLLMLGAGFRTALDATQGGSSTSAAVTLPSISTIQYGLWFDTEHPVAAEPRQWLRDYGRAFIFTTSILTLQRSRPYEPINSLGWLCMYLASVALVGQTALVLFAIRRRFKR